MAVKTNAMRILDREKISYTAQEYGHDDGLIDGNSIAKKIGADEKVVFKTLVTKGASGGYFVFVVPVCTELDLKKAAKAAGEKSVAMIPVSDINKVTGYIRGGCSPVGMKKLFPTYIDVSAESLDAIYVSAGKIGAQVFVSPNDLARVCNGKFADITAE